MSSKENKETPGMRLKKARTTLGLTQKEFGKPLGLKWHQVKDMESGKLLIRPELASKIEKIYSINLRWLLTGEGEMFVKKEKSIEDYILKLSPEEIMKMFPEVVPARPVPVINQHVPAGFPEMPLEEDQIVDWLYLPDIPKGSIAVKVKGKSMEPTIEDGDYVVFLPVNRLSEPIKPGDIVIVRNEWNEIILKRYRVKDGKVYLTSDNPKYPTIEPNENYVVVGKVIRRIKEERF